MVIDSKKRKDFGHFLCYFHLIPLEIVWYVLLLRGYKHASSIKDFLALSHEKSYMVMIYFSCTLTHLTSSCLSLLDVRFFPIFLLQEVIEKIFLLLLLTFIPFWWEEKPFYFEKSENYIYFWHYVQFYLTLLPI